MKHVAAAISGLVLNLWHGVPAVAETRAYSALNFEDEKCEILLSTAPEDSGIFCGRKIPKEDILRTTSLESKRCEGWGRYCSAQIFRHSLVYKEKDTDRATVLVFYFVNKNVSDRFTESLAAWLENAQPRPMQWEKGL